MCVSFVSLTCFGGACEKLLMLSRLWLMESVLHAFPLSASRLIDRVTPRPFVTGRAAFRRSGIRFLTSRAISF